MRKLFLNITMLFTIIIISLLVLIKLSNSNPNSYLYALKDKHNILEKTNSKKRIIFIGGSNLAFGLDSKRIDDNIEEYTVVNCGLHAGIGLRYMLNDIEKYLKKGDILIITPEYSHFFNGGWGGIETLIEILDVNKSLVEVERSHALKLLSYIPEYLNNKLLTLIRPNKIIEGLDYTKFSYDRRGFNEYGDYTLHWDKEPKKFENSKSISEPIDESLILFLENYRNKTEADVYFSYPVFQHSSYMNQEEEISKLVKKMKDINLNFINNYQNYIFDDQYFFDTYYHLNKKGVDLRTNYLLKDLMKLIND